MSEVIGMCSVCGGARTEYSTRHTMVCVRLRRLETLVFALGSELCGPWGDPALRDNSKLRTVLGNLRKDLEEGG